MSDQPVFVGLTGKAGAGKDYIADKIAEDLWNEFSIVTNKVPWARGVREEIELTVNGFMDGEGGIAKALYQKPTSDPVRRLLQFWGTDFRRSQDPDYWVKWGLQAASEYGAEVIFFPDTRFQNEVEAVYEHGFVVNVMAPVKIREQRIGKVPEHESEAYADSLRHDYRIINNGYTVVSLASIVLDILNRVRGEAR